MTPQEQREITKLLNSHASHLNTMMAVISGLISELATAGGPDSLERAKARALDTAKQMYRPMQPNADTSAISKVLDAAKLPG
ncbi:hypothetical protein [Pseudomonas putida]|uniref:hypothetical protein n=1 Tax=Pseudomonas putida TaxID=303 RepID=UPI00168B1D2D|nr:hypothetical protein [Pseudomonas putida]